MVTMGLLLALSFAVSLLALAFLIWAISNRQLKLDQEDAKVIFAEGDEGHLDSPDAEHSTAKRHYFDTATSGIDRISTKPVTVLLVAATVWLIVGSTFGLIASLKLHWPDWLSFLSCPPWSCPFLFWPFWFWPSLPCPFLSCPFWPWSPCGLPSCPFWPGFCWDGSCGGCLRSQSSTACRFAFASAFAGSICSARS